MEPGIQPELPQSSPTGTSPQDRRTSVAGTNSEPSSSSPNSDIQLEGQAGRPASLSSSGMDPSQRATVPSACVQCRSKHLKCDGMTPCTRCISNTLLCVYVRSRRGFKGPRRNGLPNKPEQLDKSCPLVYPDGRPASTNAPNASSGLVTPPDHRLNISLPGFVDLPRFDISQEVVSFDPKALPTGLDLRKRCIEAFFYHFYPAHPFVLPRKSFLSLRSQKPIDFLEAAIRYVGSIYVPQAPTVALGIEAERALYSSECPQNGFRVQAMLILSIGLDGYTDQERALQILLDAQDLALELGMNQRDYATRNGDSSDLLEESWRRTWWELYIVDGMIAGVHQKSTFRMKDIIADVLLPCEEKEFASGLIPQPHSIEDFDSDSFDDRDSVYSSFTYRITAIRNLGRFLQARMAELPQDVIIDRIDAHLVSWQLHLPKNKKDFIDHERQLDEMLFQAHMITEACLILLHREKSELDSNAARNITSCAPHKAILAGTSFNVHAAKIIQAAQAISKLIQLPVPLIKHSHFFTCVVTLASIVHLSCWSAMAPLIQDDDLKQQLRLNTGALKTLCQVWPSAGKAFEQVKGVAQEIFTEKRQVRELGYWTSLTEEEILESMVEDQRIMEDLQLLA